MIQRDQSSSTRNFIGNLRQLQGRCHRVRFAKAGSETRRKVTSYRCINRFHRGCRSRKEVEGTRGWMGHEAKQVNEVANRGQHRGRCSVSLLPALPRGGVVCTCACASRPASPHLRLFLASVYSFRDRICGK